MRAFGSSSTVPAGSARARRSVTTPIGSYRRAAIAVSSCTGTQWEIVPTPSSSPSSPTVPSPRTRAAERFGLPRPVWLLGWVSLATDAASEAIYPLLPFFLIQVLGAGAVSLGIVEGAAEAANSVLKILSGRLADRSRAKRPIVIAGYALSSAVRPLIALAQSWTHVFTVRLVDRIGKGIRGAPRDAMLATWATPSTRGKVYGFHRAMDHAGAIVGPAVASLFLLFYPGEYRTLFALTIIPGAIAVLLIFFVREDAVEPGYVVSAFRRTVDSSAESRTVGRPACLARRSRPAAKAAAANGVCFWPSRTWYVESGFSRTVDPSAVLGAPNRAAKAALVRRSCKAAKAAAPPLASQATMMVNRCRGNSSSSWSSSPCSCWGTPQTPFCC